MFSSAKYLVTQSFPILYLTYRLNSPNNNTKLLITISCGVSYSPLEIYGILMAKAPAYKKTRRAKSSKIASRTKRRINPKAISKKPVKKPGIKRRVSPKKPPLRKKGLKTKSKTTARSRKLIRKQRSSPDVKFTKSASPARTASSADEAPRLLRKTKTTSAALALLGKGIELIYQKNYRRARSELKELLAAYPSETEIRARAQSYIQICDREEESQKRSSVTNDQLYAMGVMEHNRANYDAAISYYLKSLENHPSADYIYYSLAASLAKKGDLAESMKNLRTAIELNEDSRIYAKNDADFSSLQAHKEFAELIGIVQPLASDQQ